MLRQYFPDRLAPLPVSRGSHRIRAPKLDTVAFGPGVERVPMLPASRAVAASDVLVIGGGLVGLCSAFSLARRGHSVTVIDRNEIGSGAARGNAGEVTPLTALPLAGPGLMRETIRGILSRKHYLSIAPLALPGLTSFGLSFLAHCAPDRVAAGTAALDQLTHGAFAAFDSYQSDGISLAGGGTGYLYTHNDRALLEAYRSTLIKRAQLLGMQSPDPVLSGAEMREREPALSESAPAAFIAPTERYIDPGVFVDDLCRALTELGVTLRPHTTAVRCDLDTNQPSVTVHTQTGSERLSAARVVVAGGAWSGEFLRASGVRVPPQLRVYPGRGYSFTVETEMLPGHLLGSLAERTVAIPMSGRLRIVGLMDFDGSHDRFDDARFTHLAARAQRFVQGADWSRTSEHWVGPRPMTASGVPLISALPADPRVIVAAGHNMHGLSLGPVTGEVVTALVEGMAPAVAGTELDLSAFSLPRSSLHHRSHAKGLTQ